MGTLPPFSFQDGQFFCEQVDVGKLISRLPKRIHQTSIRGKCVRTEVPVTPLVLYSKAALVNNVKRYKDALQAYNIQGVLGYAMKANGNFHLMKLFKSLGVEMLVTVSGYEILAGLKIGYHPKSIIFNGNGKQRWEIKLAIEQGVILNIDSEFDAKNVVSISSQEFPRKEVLVLLRIRPPPFECNVGVHPYVNTSASSKFGFDRTILHQILGILQEHDKIRVHGIHCHLGSCIYDPKVYEYIARFVTDLSATLTKSEIPVQLLDLGGGIGINYRESLPGIEPFLMDIPSGSNNPGSIAGLQQPEDDVKEEEAQPEIPSLLHFMKPMSDVLPKTVQILLEPGRSLVGNSGAIVTEILGVKQARDKNFVVVDAAMTDLIRPCLYGSFHRIYPLTLSKSVEWNRYDVVGPVCETADFLGRNVLLQKSCSKYLALMDCGAYASSMSSNYNMRPRVDEYLVDGQSWTRIKNREMFEDIISPYVFNS